MELKKGDIILITKGTWWGVLSPLIKLFTWRYWEKGEPIPTAYHAEICLDYDSLRRIYEALSAQPPAVRKVRRYLKDVKVRVFRLKDRPLDIGYVINEFVKENEGKLYDMPTFMMFGLDWVFHTYIFSKMMSGKTFQFCAELVARFYSHRLRVPCSDRPPQSTSPDNILDYCTTSDKYIEVTV